MLDNEIEKLNLKNEVFIFSNVSDENLFSAYKQCILLVFPSLYEGFGIPILEALKFKSKICLSNLNLFKEITQNNLNYFNPSSLSSIVKVINTTIKQPKPKKF